MNPMSEVAPQPVVAGIVCFVGSTATPEAQQLAARLSDAGFAVYSAPDVGAAEAGAQTAPPDAMLLACDVGGAGAEPSAAVQHLRRAAFDGLIVVLGARWEPSYAVNVLNSGADDYVRCPYDPAEVVAWLRVLAARAAGLSRLCLDGGIVFDRLRRVIRCAEKEVSLTAKEAAVLTCLSRKTGRVVPLEKIVTRVWDAADVTESLKNLVEVYVSYVRRKLARVNCPLRVRTVRGVGYQLTESTKHCSTLASPWAVGR